MTNRVVLMLGTLLLLVTQNTLTARSQPDPEVAIDRIFRYNSSMPGSDNQARYSLIDLKKWMGAYQRTLATDGTYVAIFDRGSIPLTVELKDSGDIKNLVMGCPMSKSASLSEAPLNLQKLWMKCKS